MIQQEEEEADPMVDEEEQEEEEEEATPPQESSSEPMSWSSRVKMGSGGKPPVVPGTGSKEGTPFTQPAAGQGKPYRGNRGTSQVYIVLFSVGFVVFRSDIGSGSAKK